MYSDEEYLLVDKRIGITKEVYQIIKKEKKKLREQGRRVSMAKIVCNAIMEKYT